MEITQAIALILSITGLFIYFNLTPSKIINELIEGLSQDRKSLRGRIKRAALKKESPDFIQLITKANKILTVNGKGAHFPIVCLLSAAGVATGIFLGLLMHNMFATPILAFSLGMIPFIVVRFLSYGYQKTLNIELTKSLSVITTTYLRQENFVEAVRENIDAIQGPLRNVFTEFLFEIDNINPNVVKALINMSKKIENNTWNEWCDKVVICQSNKNLRSILPPIIKKFSDIRLVTEDLSYVMYGPVKDLMTMCVMLGLTPVALYFAKRDWFAILSDTIPGNIVIAVIIFAVFISVNAGVKNLKPIEYKR